MSRSIIQWVPNYFPLISIYCLLPKPCFSPPSDPLGQASGNPACACLHTTVTPTQLQHRLFLPPAGFWALSGQGLTGGPDNTAQPGIPHPGLGPGSCLQQTSGTYQWVGRIFWAGIPEASEPASTLCHATPTASPLSLPGLGSTRLPHLHAEPYLLDALQIQTQQPAVAPLQALGLACVHRGTELTQRDG